MPAATACSNAGAGNPSLYSVTNVTYTLPMLGELPQAFGKPIGHSRQGLLTSSGLIILHARFSGPYCRHGFETDGETEVLAAQ